MFDKRLAVLEEGRLFEKVVNALEGWRNWLVRRV